MSPPHQDLRPSAATSTHQWSFGILAGEDTFARARDERMNYLERLADA